MNNVQRMRFRYPDVFFRLSVLQPRYLCRTCWISPSTHYKLLTTHWICCLPVTDI